MPSPELQILKIFRDLLNIPCPLPKSEKLIAING
jgi:hypothetical protein